VCGGSGKKLCELCGGKGWNPGPFVPCPGAGCTKDTGSYKVDCTLCHGRGEITPQIECTMCRDKDAKGFTLMVCQKCKGSGKYSTGRKGGSVDFFNAARCSACDGTTWAGKWKPQDVKQFRNAQLVSDKGRVFDVLGPIREFAIQDPRTSRTRLFTVDQDSAGDYLVLLVPKSKRQRPQKAYLVGGVVRERMTQSGAA
jgi:hypothetical protein